MKKKLLLALFLITTITMSGCDYVDGLKNAIESKAAQTEPQSSSEGAAKVCFIDVGQGDSTFIELPDGKNLLIDGGSASEKEAVMQAITETKIEKIDVVIATHPHEDHIGGLPEVLDSCEVGKIYMPNATANTKIYGKLLDAIETNGCEVAVPDVGDALLEGEGYSLVCLSPRRDEEYQDLNDYSIVCKLTVENESIMFMGDAEELTENQILETFPETELKSTYLKAGHHGSNTSTSDKFLAAVDPDAAIISCGQGNKYGHPHKTTIKKLELLGCKIMRTDESGTLKIELQ